MFNLTEAFTYIFKEKNWGWKFLIPFALQLIIIIPSILMEFGSGNIGENYFNTGHMGYRYSYGFGNDGSGVFSLLFFCIFLIGVVPYIVVNLWYMYENTQAGIFSRATKAIWENDLSDTLKKSGKYFLVSLLYGLLAAFVILIVLGIFCVGFAILTAVGSSGLQLNDIQNNPGFFFATGAGIFLFCIMLFVGLALYALFYLMFTPAILRMVGSNSFSEGLKIGEAWRIGWKYKWRFFSLLMLILLYTIMIGIFGAAVGSFALIIGQSSPALNLVFQGGYQVAIALVTTYFGYFVYTRLLGQVFRSIVKDEESLKFIKL